MTAKFQPASIVPVAAAVLSRMDSGHSSARIDPEAIQRLLISATPLTVVDATMMLNSDLMDDEAAEEAFEASALDWEHQLKKLSPAWQVAWYFPAFQVMHSEATPVCSRELLNAANQWYHARERFSRDRAVADQEALDGYTREIERHLKETA